MQKTGWVQAPSVVSCLFSYCPALKYSIKRTAPKVSKGRRLASGESAEGGSRKRSDNDRNALWGVRLSSPVATRRKPNESAETSGLWPRRLRLRTPPAGAKPLPSVKQSIKRERHHFAGGFCAQASTACAAGRVMPGTASSSSSVAWRSAFSDPKRFSSALRRLGPTPGMSSSWL